MQILSPLSEIRNFEPLAEAGADEFFADLFLLSGSINFLPLFR